MVERAGTSSSPADRGADSNMHMDDINIPLVAVSVVFFGVLLAVLIAGLQAFFNNYQAMVRTSPDKMLVRDDPRTDLGKLWQIQRKELNDPNDKTIALYRLPAATTASQQAPAPAARMTIAEAMQKLAKEGE